MPPAQVRKDCYFRFQHRHISRGGGSRRYSELDDLWRHMDRGDYSPGVGERLLRFNGKLFKNAAWPLLTKDEIRLLRDASDADWRDLEPAVFGNLFEQALDPIERKRLGAHYTPALTSNGLWMQRSLSSS